MNKDNNIQSTDSSESASSNRRIAKNAAALYFRMIITMLVGLYTSRVILQALGVEDYGIYNVVGGFVSMFSLISGSLQGSVGRFLTFELGTGNKEKLSKIFTTSFIVMIGLSCLIVIATESVGLWYLYNKMVIPTERMDAAFWCFQLSIASFVLSLLSAPYSSSIIAHERMGIYAYISILDAIFKLLICFAVMASPIDKLVYYAILVFLVSVIDQIIYWTYCTKKFEECKLIPVFDKVIFKQMFGFAGWNFIGGSAGLLRSQGASLMLNAFGGPVVNAANGIANSICNLVSVFVGSFTQAFNPQITKRYAAKEYESLMQLLIYGSKYSYYLMFILALPIFFNAKFILQIWLSVVPEHTVAFTRWILVFLLAESISRPIITAKNATGKIRNYQLVVGGILLLTLPISYIGLKSGLSVTFVACANTITAILAFFARMYMLRGDIPFWSSRIFFRKVFMNVLYVSVLACVPTAISYNLMPEGWANLLMTTPIAIVSSLLVIYHIGCSKSEKIIIKSKGKSLISKLKPSSLHKNI